MRDKLVLTGLPWLAGAAALLAVLGLIVAPSVGRSQQESRSFFQPEARDAAGRITVEASIIHVIGCNNAQYYIYQYVNRPGYRAILPPNWGNALGGRDFATYQEAVGAACSGYAGGAAGGSGAVQTGSFQQAEQRDASGRITVEASIIHVISCNNAQYYIYQYVNRPGYRAILPPNWGNALGGRDFATYDEAAGAACGAGGVGSATPTRPGMGAGGITVLSGTYGGNCRQPQGNVTGHLASACNGRQSCDYPVDYTVIGDPAVGCLKDYVATWQCPDGGRGTASAAPEAGYRSVVRLSCPVP